MSLAKHTVTGIVADYPDNILNHRILGQYLEPYVEPADEEEEDKTVIDKRVYKKSTAPAKDTITDEEPTVADSFDSGVSD